MDLNIERIYLDIVDSTNNYCKELIRNGKNNNFLVVSNEQTAGRGRLGRSFFSPKDTGIYMSLALKYDENFNILSTTTKTALSVLEALKEFTDKDLKIKWVNDIYLNDKKVSGILTESCYTDKAKFIIIGIGINIYDTKFPNELKEIASSLNIKENNRDKIINRIICNILHYLFSDPNNEYINMYKKYSNCLNKDIYYIKNDNKYYGHVIDFTENGELVLINEDNKTVILNSGEISIKTV